ncbi:MAG: ATP-binding cassette domain-containing protein [Chitinophagales bacterium]|jgi:ATPase subunit of ABC transporter with duplicated ATPase domains|nr:ATP-binding cassette domain-containing protein [Chitinophagales bacterium]
MKKIRIFAANKFKISKSMVSVNKITLQYDKKVLFEDVNLTFSKGNCYGIIGANGAGKSTFLKILSGEIEPNKGSVDISPGERMAVLKQNHQVYDDFTVLNTVLMGHDKLWKIMNEKDALYAKEDFSEADGMKAAELEAEFAELDGWMAESNAGELLSNLGVDVSTHYALMKDIDANLKVRVLLAQALFGNPDILLLDEPTNDLDIQTINWLEDFLADFPNIVIVVSHDRHFLDMVCTHICDIDFKKISIYSGNYSFWYHASQLALRQRQDKNKKAEQKREELLEFIRRFSANASKSKQATSRKKALEKLNIDDIQPSTRRYPAFIFQMDRELGNQVLEIEKLSYRNNDTTYFTNIEFQLNKNEKVAIISQDSLAVKYFYEIISGEREGFSGSYKWGQTVTYAYLPSINDKYFTGDLNLVDWLRQYSEDKDENYIRGFLGKMLFSGEDVFKKSNVLSGGEKVRCMLSKVMMTKANVLILEEPTGHLDLESITALNESLKDFSSNLLFTSQDREFTQTIANRIIELTPNGVIDKLVTYDEYILDPKIQALRQEMYR